jgi:hypothetical protein
VLPQVLEDNTTDCCRLVAPAGETALTLALNCSFMPMYTCYENEENKLERVSALADAGSCPAACNARPGCVPFERSITALCRRVP